MERFFVVQTSVGYTIGCQGHNMTLPFSYIKEHNAKQDVCDLNTGKETVASLYWRYIEAGSQPIGTKPRKYSEWLKRNEKNFEFWYQD